MEERDELKPCPFCGGAGHVYEDGRLSSRPYDFPKWYITCKKCGVETPTARIEQVVEIWNRRTGDGKEAIRILSQLADGDTISRQAAIDALDEQIEQCNKALGSFDISPKDEYAIKVERASLKAYRELLENLPSAQPEQNGKWIYNSPTTMKCDRCGFVIKDWDWHRFKFCPNCDCDMRGEQK